MHRWALWLVALGIGLAAMPATPGSATPGRVVRIERPTRRTGKAIRVCHFTMLSRAQMTCISAGDLEIGEQVAVLAEDRSFERVEITGISPSRLDTCRLGHAVDVGLKPVAGSRIATPQSQNTRHTTRFAVRGVDVTPGISKLLSNNGSIKPPSGHRDENVFMAADLDGDDRPDLVGALHNRCKQVSARPSWVPSGKVVTSWCIDYWRRGEGESWTLANSEFVHFCQ